MALVTPDPKFLGQRHVEKILAARGYNSERYICLLLRDLVWIHNYIIVQVIQCQRRERDAGKLTQDGRAAQKRKHPPNSALVRNSNLAPASKKTLEGKTLRKIRYEEKAFNEIYRFLFNLIDRGQVILGQIADKPLINVKKLLM